MASRKLPDDFHALYDRGFRAARGLAPAALPRRTPGHSRLATQVPDLQIDYDEATQLPNRISSRLPAARLSPKRTTSPEQAATDFIRDQGDLWNLTAEDLTTVEVVSVSRRGLPTVNLMQRVDGTDVFNSELTAAVTASNEVISLAGQLFPGAAAARGRARAALNTAEEAIAKASADLTGDVYEAGDFAAGRPAAPPYRQFEFKPSAGDRRPAFRRPVRVKAVMFPLGEGRFVPAHYLELWI
jgi:hypothetical protein